METHSERKEARLRDQIQKYQEEIGRVHAEHAADLNEATVRVCDAATHLSVIESDVQEAEQGLQNLNLVEENFQRQIRQLQDLIQQNKLEVIRLHTYLSDLKTSQATAQAALDEERAKSEKIADPPKRQIVSLAAKRDNVKRRLDLHLARQPLPALVPA